MNLRDQHSLGLLCCTLCDLLPANHLLCCLLNIQFHHTSLCLYRDYRKSSQLYCFLDDQFHLVCFRQSLKKIKLIWQLIFRLLCIEDMQQNLILSQFFNLAVVFFISSVTDPHILPTFHAENVFNMIYIRPIDVDTVCLFLNLIRLHKKTLHRISPFLLLRKPSRPDVSLLRPSGLLLLPPPLQLLPSHQEYRK